MLISYNWLKKYANLNGAVTAEEMAAKLKNATVEVEKVENLGAALEGIVVGKVLSCEKHPNADKLKVCEVDIGEEKTRVICGGSNVVEGVLVAFAKVGAKVRWHGEGEAVELEPAKIRGVESRGMICASTEIGLGEMFPLKDEKEILDLTSVILAKAGICRRKVADSRFRGNDNGQHTPRPSARGELGQPLAQALGLNDVILEIDNKSLSHRPDLWGHYGIAREVAVLFNKDLKPYETEKIKEGKEIKLKIKVDDGKLCPRFMAVAMSGVKVGESPESLKQALLAVGLRPINNLVDITNYVMLDLGKPMHVFDSSVIPAKAGIQRLHIRKARQSEQIAALDGKTYDLDESILVVADEEKPLALAGIIGGEESGVTETTTDVIFETAIWDPAYIRKTSNKLGLRTDAALRFEKSLDPNWCELSLQKAVELVLQLCPGAQVASNIADEGKVILPVGPIEVARDIFSKKLGADIQPKEIVNILTRLGFAIKEKKDILSIKIPTWRATKDIAIAEDIVEEVARVYGFNNIPSSLPNFPITPPEENKLRKLERRIKDALVMELGCTEVCNYSFVSAGQIAKLGDASEKYIELDNPLSKEKPFLRRNLLPNLLENVEKNINRADELKIFEIGKVFRAEEIGYRVKANRDELLPRQDSWLTALFASKTDAAPFWQARRAAENIFSALNMEWSIAHLDKIFSWEHPARVAMFACGGKTVGVMHELHPSVAANFGIAARVGVLRLNLDTLDECLTRTKPSQAYHPVPTYPEVERDIAFLVKKEITHQEILSALENTGPLLRGVEIFDVYEGQGVGAGYKSMAYHLTYAHPERTLTAEEVDKAQAKAIQVLEQKFGAEIRK